MAYREEGEGDGGREGREAEREGRREGNKQAWEGERFPLFSGKTKPGGIPH